MTDKRSFRLQVLDKIVALIRTVSPENDFINDLSKVGHGEDSVIIGRLFIGDDEPIPMVAINEPPLAIEPIKAQENNPARVTDWDLLVQGWAEVGEIHATEHAYNLAAEVGQVLASEKTKRSGRPGTGNGNDLLGFGTRIIDMRIGAPVVRPPDDVSAKACFYIILTLQISEDMTKPFS